MKSSKARSRGPWLWPLLLVITGIALLLDNFLLLGDFDVTNLWPLLLVIVGAQILLRGDVLPSEGMRTFGITRGSVESGTLELNAGAIDVGIRALQSGSGERLIAGQYAAQSRPDLQVDDTHAHLRMDRAKTRWLSFADWEMGVTDDMPWGFLISTHLGQVKLDCSTLITQNAVVATGIGDIRFVCPYEAFEPLYLRSALGNIHMITPPGHNARITVDDGRFLGVHSDETRYEQVEPHVFVSLDNNEDAPLIDIYISGTFGDVYLA